MSVAHKRFRTGIASVLAWTTLVVTQSAVAADAPRDRMDPIETAAARRDEHPPTASASAPARAETPAVRRIESDESVSGAEPDPETFDRQGLESWWRVHRQSDR